MRTLYRRIKAKICRLNVQKQGHRVRAEFWEGITFFIGAVRSLLFFARS